MQGAYFEYANKEFFYPTNETRRTKKLVKMFLTELLKTTNLSKTGYYTTTLMI